MGFTIVVIDGMGGSIGQQIVLRLRENFPKSTILALGTNAVAAQNMMKAGATQVASGENAFRITLKKVDVIVAPLAVALPHSMMGEVTPAMAEAIALAEAKKFFLPLTNPKIEIAGLSYQPIPHLMEEITEKLKNLGVE